jgi:hypothetical protein
VQTGGSSSKFKLHMANKKRNKILLKHDDKILEILLSHFIVTVT